MYSGTWQWILVERNAFSGHRIKRVLNNNPGALVIPKQGISSSNNVNSSFPLLSDPIPPPTFVLNTNGVFDNYVFGFWSMSAVDANGTVITLISGSRNATFGLGNGPWLLTAKAWYFWDFASGPGPHGIYLDAFDIQANDYIANDFVTVSPDDSIHTLQNAGNNGLIDTSAFTKAQVETITAQDIGSNLAFDHWQTVDQLTHAGDSTNLPNVNGRNITCRLNDILVSVAMYNEVPQPPRKFGPVFGTNPILVFAPSDAGLVRVPIGTPPEPIGGPFSEAVAAFNILQAAQLVRGRDQSTILKLAQQTFNTAVRELLKQSKSGK